MYYELPDMDKAYQLNSQYFFGNDMIVAPVCHSMKGNETAEQSVWLPDGYWYDFRNNKQVMGGQTIKARYALDEIPIYVRAGSIIPSQTGKLRIEGSVLDTLILTVYPAQQAKFSLYEDEGNNENYKQGVYSYTHITYLQQNGTCSLAIEPDGKTFTGQVSERCYRLCVVALAKPATVKINGHTATEGQEWSYNPATATATITTARQKMGSRFVIEIK
jgi:alpha-glucosidase (family GH31 glycosyl hydrolase)